MDTEIKKKMITKKKKRITPGIEVSHQTKWRPSLQSALPLAGHKAQHSRVLRGLQVQRAGTTDSQGGQQGNLQTPLVHIQYLRKYKIISKHTRSSLLWNARAPAGYSGTCRHLKVFLHRIQELHFGSQFFKLGLEFGQHRFGVTTCGIDILFVYVFFVFFMSHVQCVHTVSNPSLQ